MFKIFSFLKYAALLAVFGVLAVFSSLSFGDNVIEKEKLEQSGAWRVINSVISTLASAATDLGRANIESKIPLSSNIDVEAVSKSFSEVIEADDLDVSGSADAGNAAWADFFAKVKEEWGKTNLE